MLGADVGADVKVFPPFRLDTANQCLWRRGEFGRDERILLTPHTSASSDVDKHGAVELFCRNLRAYLDRTPLINVIDWERGY